MLNMALFLLLLFRALHTIFQASVDALDAGFGCEEVLGDVRYRAPGTDGDKVRCSDGIPAGQFNMSQSRLAVLQAGVFQGEDSRCGRHDACKKSPPDDGGGASPPRISDAAGCCRGRRRRNCTFPTLQSASQSSLARHRRPARQPHVTSFHARTGHAPKSTYSSPRPRFCHRISLFFFILTLAEDPRSRMRAPTNRSLHCTAGRKGLSTVLRGRRGCNFCWQKHTSFLFHSDAGLVLAWGEEDG